MLLVSRLENQTLVIGDDIEIKIVRVEGRVVCLGVKAPKEKLIHRKEFFNQVKNSMKETQNEYSDISIDANGGKDE